jgi:hypothetical protein
LRNLDGRAREGGGWRPGHAREGPIESLFDGKPAPASMTSWKPDTDGSAAWTSTVRVSTEPIRSNLVPVIMEWAAKLVEEVDEKELVGATIAMRMMDQIVATSEGVDLGALDMEHFVQVVEYDPVRHMAMVIGTRDAPRVIPLVWLMLRVFPGAAGVAVLPSVERGEVVFLRSAVRGSFDEAFAVGELMSGHGKEGILGPAAKSFERVGTVLVVPPGGDPATVLRLLVG